VFRSHNEILGQRFERQWWYRSGLPQGVSHERVFDEPPPSGFILFSEEPLAQGFSLVSEEPLAQGFRLLSEV
jgi:hypothetical protein